MDIFGSSGDTLLHTSKKGVGERISSPAMRWLFLGLVWLSAAMDDECAEDGCALNILQLSGRKTDASLEELDEVNGTSCRNFILKGKVQMVTHLELCVRLRQPFLFVTSSLWQVGTYPNMGSLNPTSPKMPSPGPLDFFFKLYPHKTQHPGCFDPFRLRSTIATGQWAKLRTMGSKDGWPMAATSA